MAMTKIFERPAIAKIPKIDNIQRIRTTDAICLIGLGRIPINQRITKNIRRSQTVINRPFKVINGKAKTWNGP